MTNVPSLFTSKEIKYMHFKEYARGAYVKCKLHSSKELIRIFWVGLPDNHNNPLLLYGGGGILFMCTALVLLQGDLGMFIKDLCLLSRT
jgi:hypothetical protein